MNNKNIGESENIADEQKFDFSHLENWVLS